MTAHQTFQLGVDCFQTPTSLAALLQCCHSFLFPMGLVPNRTRYSNRSSPTKRPLAYFVSSVLLKLHCSKILIFMWMKFNFLALSGWPLSPIPRTSKPVIPSSRARSRPSSSTAETRRERRSCPSYCTVTRPSPVR